MSFIAHRGESEDAPENTMAAFKLAWERNCDGIECDVWMTLDRVIVCHHDRTFQRTSGQVVDLTSMSYDAIRKLDVGSWKDRRWKDERVPTLGEVLASAPEGKKVFIEIKDTERVVSEVLACVEASGIDSSRIRIISFDENVIKEWKRVNAEVKAFLLLCVEPNLDSTSANLVPSPEELVDKLGRLGADGVDVGAIPEITKKYVEFIHDAGYEFHVWTIDDVETSRRFIELGVDSITSNNASRLTTLLLP